MSVLAAGGEPADAQAAAAPLSCQLCSCSTGRRWVTVPPGVDLCLLFTHTIVGINISVKHQSRLRNPTMINTFLCTSVAVHLFIYRFCFLYFF